MDQNPEIKILFEDQHLLVLSKPAGLDSQGGNGIEDHLVKRLQDYLGRPYVGLVHRLDRNTSGLMVVAKRTKSAQRLSDSIQKGELERNYLAIVLGEFKEEIKATHWLNKDESKNLVKCFSGQELAPQGSKKAVTCFVPKMVFQKKQTILSLVECILESGRSHQIRVQAQALGHSLVGDRKYGDESFDFGRPALHSYSLSFPHPMSQERLIFLDTLPGDMLALIPSQRLDELNTLINKNL